MKKRLLSLFLILCLALCLLPGAAPAAEDFSGYTKVTTFDELKTAAANAGVTGILVVAPPEEGRILVTEDVNLAGKKLCIESTNLRIMENATLTLGSMDDLYFADAGGNIRVLEGGGTIVIGGTKLVSASDETAVFFVKTNGILVNGLVSLPDEAYPVNAGEDGSIFIVGDADSHGGTVPSGLTVVMDAFGDGNTLNVLGDLTVGHFDVGDQNVTVAEGVKFTILDRVEAPTAESKVRGLTVNDVDVASAPDPTDVLGDGTVRFDADTGILTLTNANLTKGLSDTERASEEHPAISFGGQLTIHLRGSNTIDTGTDTVMGQALRNSAVFGDELTVTAEPGATLAVKGMVQVRSYTQTGGAVSVEMENSHSQITKWAMYVMGGALRVSGGTLTAASTGGKRGGAIGLEDGGALSFPDGTVLTEGDWGFDNQVSVLSLSGGLMPTSKNYVRIEAPVSAAPKNIAYESAQMIELDGGTKVRLPAYALKDANGNPTNYVRLRDLAQLLNSSEAEFDVLWSAETGITIAPHTPYDHPNGSEGNVPFSGDRPYADYTQPTYVGDELKALAAFQIADDDGGGHTYYQLRDLGRALDFNVGWSTGRGIFIETDKAYTDAD